MPRCQLAPRTVAGGGPGRRAPLLEGSHRDFTGFSSLPSPPARAATLGQLLEPCGAMRGPPAATGLLACHPQPARACQKPLLHQPCSGGSPSRRSLDLGQAWLFWGKTRQKLAPHAVLPAGKPCFTPHGANVQRFVLKFTVCISCVCGVYGAMHDTAGRGEPGCVGQGWGSRGHAPGPLCQQQRQAQEGDRCYGEPFTLWFVPLAQSPVGILQGEAINQMD